MMTTSARRQSPTRLACMELRGGNVAVEDNFAMPGLDVWVYSRPFEQSRSGGDVHYVSTCATGRIARVLVADVSGHGDEVGTAGAILRGLMAKYVNFLDQRKFFAAMNRRFADLASTGGKFATAVVMTYFAPTATLSVSNAGHPPPLLWRAGERRWSFLQHDCAPHRDGGALAENLPLGVLDAARYDRFDLQLGPDDLVLCYTDSLVEARDADGQLLSMAGLLRIADDVDGTVPAGVVPDFLAALGALRPGNLAGDDVTLLVFKPNGGAVRVPVADRLAAPGRVVGGLWRWATGRGDGSRLPEFSLANLGGALFDPLSHLWNRRAKPSP